MIDKLDDEHIYTVEMLREMKKAHEQDMKLENYGTGAALYDTVIHDYSALSTLFYYFDINGLYSSSIDLPYFIDINLGELSNMVENYKLDLGDFYLRDKYLNKLFVKLLDSERFLWKVVKETFDFEHVCDRPDAVQKFSCELKHDKTKADIKWVDYWTCTYQESVDGFINAIKNRYPEILYSPVYKTFPNI